MANINTIDKFFKRLDDYGKRAVPSIISEKATEFYKHKFTTKEWDGRPWEPTKRIVKSGSLMVRSGKLMNSIRPKTVSLSRVVVSAGGSVVPYAKALNEGETITIPVTAKMRKFAWAKYYEEAGKGIKTGKGGNTYQGIGAGKEANRWKGLALTPKQTLTVKLPERRFMGKSAMLNSFIFQAFKEEFKNLF